MNEMPNTSLPQSGNPRSQRLAGKVALVTGGARGIGRGIADAFIAEGAIVSIVDLKQERVDSALAALTANGGVATGEAGDVSDRNVLQRCANNLLARFSRFDILVNNAMWARYQPLSELTPENLDGMVNVGFKSVVWGMQIAEQIMAPRGGGVIVNISSVAAARSVPDSMVYSGVKAGVSGLTRSGAVDLGPKGIRVNAIAPGTTMTEGIARNLSEEAMKHRLSRVPLKRLGKVGDMGAAAVFLASDESAWINGVTLFVDGGITAAFL